MMILKMLGGFDILVGILLIFNSAQQQVFFIPGSIALLKGLYSCTTNASDGNYFDIMSILDILAGLSLIIGASIPFLWLFLIIKGIVSLV